MKKHIVIFFLIFFFFTVSCRTLKDQSDSQQQGTEEEEVASASEVIGEGGVDEDLTDEGDLEDEFSDSEDFEKEMAEEAFPSESPTQETVKQPLADSSQQEASKKEAEEDDLFVEDEEIQPEQLAEGSDEDEEIQPEQLAEGSDEDEDEEIQPEQLAEDSDEDEDSDLVSDQEADSSTSVIVNNIRYEAGENKVYIDGTGAFSYQSRQNKANNQFIIEIPGAVLSESLRERPFVMKDFNTAIALLQADQKDSNTVRVVVQMRENAGMPSISVSESGSLVMSPDGRGDSGQVAGNEGTPSKQNVTFINGQQSNVGSGGAAEQILPAKSLAEFFLQTPQFTGRPISIHLRDISVRDVLYFISEGTGLNMVLSDDVTGNISIKLRNVPWDQALVTVMKTKKLGYIREGNVIRIMSLTNLKKDHADIKEMLEAQRVLDPLRVKVIPLIYKKAADMEKQVANMTTKDRGRVIVDTQSNSLIVTDTGRSIELIEIMVKNLDQSPAQVMIEAKVIEARERFVRNLGVGWSFDGTAFDTSNLGLDPRLGLSIDGGLEAFPGNVSSGRTVSSNLRVSFAPVGDLDITLGLSEAEDLIHVISAPRIMVLNGEKAKITQKTEDIDLVTTTQQGAGTETSPQRVSADLEFEVSPQITAVGSVFMDIKVKREFFGPPEPDSGSRPINSREAETKVLVNNGQTIVIGGIYQHDETKSDEGIPILRHIPILNWLFSRFTKDEQRNELLLFLTPRIMSFSSVENSTGG